MHSGIVKKIWFQKSDELPYHESVFVLVNTRLNKGLLGKYKKQIKRRSY
jgi:hypothetical protein